MGGSLAIPEMVLLPHLAPWHLPLLGAYAASADRASQKAPALIGFRVMHPRRACAVISGSALGAVLLVP